MPVQQIGDRTNLDKGDMFIALKSKGEQITFRLAQPTYTYDAKHFTKQSDGKWSVAECPRIMSEQECDNCNRYFEYSRELKQLKKDYPENELAPKMKELDELAGKFKPKTTFYYAILNRTTKQAQILQVSLSVRLKLDEYFNSGFKVVDSDFIYTRTEKPGTEYYSLLRKDSADITELDETETKEMQKAKSFKLEELTLSKTGSHTLEEAPLPEEPEA